MAPCPLTRLRAAIGRATLCLDSLVCSLASRNRAWKGLKLGGDTSWMLRTAPDSHSKSLHSSTRLKEDTRSWFRWQVLSQQLVISVCNPVQRALQQSINGT